MTRLPHQHERAVARVAGAALLATAGIAGSLVGPRPAPATAAVPAPPVRLPVVADAVRDEQWQLAAFNAKAAWKVATGKGITVAVVDSGVDASHADLAGQVLPGIDLVEGTGNGQTDPVGHGTTVAALIAGRNDDTRGVVGLAPKAKILPVRVLDEENRYDDALIVAKGVRWAVDNGAQVVNLSLGGTGDSPALAAALDYAAARDVVVVACTGNLGSSAGKRVWYPAREPGVVAVAGLERESDALWSGSITGPETVLSAPATGLTGARPGGFWRVQGTSFAAPLVAASAALVRSHWPKMSAGDVVNRLINTARDVGPSGRDDRFGFGVVDPVAALNGEVSSVRTNPLDDGEAPPGVAGFGSAPGQEPTSPPASEGPEGVGTAASGRSADWTAEPAGNQLGRPLSALWNGGGVLFLVLAAGVALVVRRRLHRDRP
ncbi:type VII secretion-associated serine protease [Plantactinospora endophytica]|uniref:Type VII secretion-associated serine protease n=1 Tax=Plantactinospora endophytica TaxID=673535 RepID=A0ABQ4DRZ0_9ACTN|nr:type VII secretion-associated serine protease [Plantactinospora endophytica]